VVGEPGIGKSRLLSELATRAVRRDYLVLGGRAAEFERDVPFGLIVDALNDYLGSLQSSFLRALDDRMLVELASIFPALSSFLGEAESGGLPSDRFRAQYAIRMLLERLSARQPVVLLLDDVHWADGASIEVIAHISRRFRGPLLAGFAFRQAPARLASALHAAARAGFGSRLDLVPLTAEEAEALIGPAFDPATRAALYRESGGNPFYLEQLVRATTRQKLHVLSEAEDPRHGARLPATVAEAIGDEVAMLRDETRVVLDAAAVAGESFEPELVGAIAERPATLDALDELLKADLIRTTEAPRRFRFRHPIVRRAVYDRMGRGWQLGAHARAAAWLAATGAPPSARAHHVERSATSGDDEAIALLVEAARAAAPRAPVTTGRWLQAANSLLASGAAPERHIELLGEAGLAFAAAGAYEASLGSFEAALALVPRERVRERAELSVEVAEVRQHGIRRFESQPLLREALRDLPTDSPTALTVRLALAHDHFWRGEFPQMRELATGVSASARTVGPRAILATTLASLADFYDGRLELALSELLQAEQALTALSDEEVASRMDLPSQIGLAACRLERFEQARDHVRRGLRISRETGQSSMLPTLLRVDTAALLMQGQLADAIQVGRAATEAALLSGNERLAMWALEAAAMAEYWAGDTERALAGAREAVSSAERTAEPFFSGMSRIQLAGALLASGEPAAARAELVALDTERSRRLLDLSAGHGWTLLTQACVALGELAEAMNVAARAESRAADTPTPQQVAGARCAGAEASLAQGDARSAIRASLDATDRFHQAGNPLFAAHARVIAGAAFAAAGERQAAINELELADSVLSGCGARREAAAAARELRRLGRRVFRRRPASQWDLTALSSREREIAHHVTMGATNREVAAALFLSEKTVGSHLARIYDKLGVHSRAALAAIIVREGNRESPSPPADLGPRGGGQR